MCILCGQLLFNLVSEMPMKLGEIGSEDNRVIRSSIFLGRERMLKWETRRLLAIRWVEDKKLLKDNKSRLQHALTFEEHIWLENETFFTGLVGVRCWLEENRVSSNGNKAVEHGGQK